MLFTKLKALAAVAVVTLAAVPAAWPTAPAAPPAAAPPVAADKPAQLWLLYPLAGQLVSLHADGTVDRTVAVPDADAFVHVAPRQNKLWFSGVNGRAFETRVADQLGYATSLSLHVRTLNCEGAPADAGVGLKDSAGVFIANGRSAVTVRGKPEDGFENSLTDIAAKSTTKLDHLPKTHQVAGVFPDGRSVLTVETPPGGKILSSRLHQTAVAGGEPRLLSGTMSVPFGGAISPDGTKVLACGRERPWKDVPGSDDVCHLYVIDVASGKATRISDEARLGSAYGRWSPDGKRIAYVWRELTRTDKKKGGGAVIAGPARLVVRDADGKNPKTLVTGPADTVKEDFRVVAWE